MSEGIAVSRDLALSVASNIIKVLEPLVDRVEIAGSLRRERKTVNDIEIVCTLTPQVDLLGNRYTDPDRINYAIADAGWIIRKSGEKYKKIMVGPVGVDLFITTPDQWGLIFMLRTGCAEFSKLMVTPRRLRGLMPSNMRVDGGRLWQGRKSVPVPEESDLFAAYGLRFIPPKFREPAYFELIRNATLQGAD